VRAGEGPFLRPPDQPSRDRVLYDVASRNEQVSLVADETVEVLSLPQDARASEEGVDVMCGEGLPGVQDAGEVVALQWAKDDVDVVWHDDPSAEVIAVSVEVSKGVGHDLGGAWVMQDAGAKPLVEDGFDFWIRDGSPGGRKRVGEPESHEDEKPLVIAMG
jgi:hypothetical protein